MRKIFLIIALTLFLMPSLIYAGLVPCGNLSDNASTTTINESDPCTLCHIFVLFQNIINFILWVIAPPLAILMIAIGGFMYMFGGGNPSMLKKAKEILKATGIGLLIIYGAWIVVNTLLTGFGLIDITFGWNPVKWFEISCL